MGSRFLQNGIPVEREADDEILATPFTQEMFIEGFNNQPFKNELARIKHIMLLLKQKHEDKKSKLQPQYEQEMENIKRRYDMFHKIENAAFKKEKELLQVLRQNVGRGLSAGKEFGAPFGGEMEASASHIGLVPGQVSSFIFGPAPRDQVEGHAIGSILGPGPRDQDDDLGISSILGSAPPRAVAQLDSSSILGPAPI